MLYITLYCSYVPVLEFSFHCMCEEKYIGKECMESTREIILLNSAALIFERGGAE